MVVCLGCVVALAALVRSSEPKRNGIVLKSNPDIGQRIDAGAGDDIVYGRGGQDELRGSEGNDQMIGGPDDDVISGGTGSDAYYYYAGDGSDTIIERADEVSQIDFLGFADLGRDEIETIRAGSDLILRIAKTCDELTVEKQFVGYSGLEQIQFRMQPGYLAMTLWQLLRREDL